MAHLPRATLRGGAIPSAASALIHSCRRAVGPYGRRALRGPSVGSLGSRKGQIRPQVGSSGSNLTQVGSNLPLEGGQSRARNSSSQATPLARPHRALAPPKEVLGPYGRTHAPPRHSRAIIAWRGARPRKQAPLRAVPASLVAARSRLPACSEGWGLRVEGGGLRVEGSWFRVEG